MSLFSNQPAASPGGQLRIQAGWRAASLSAVMVTSQRPSAILLLKGRFVNELPQLVQRLFSLCGQAQGAVARAALAAADGAEGAAPAGEALVREAIGEHLWRFLVDWPQQLAQGDSLRSPQRDSLRSSQGDSLRSQKKQADATFAGFYRRLRGIKPDEATSASAIDAAARLWRDLDAWYRAASPESVVEQLAAWDQRVLPAAPLGLPEIDPALAQQLFAGADGGFAEQPVWRGAAAEVGAFAQRMFDPDLAALHAAGRPLAARYLARWRALGAAIAALEPGAAAVAGPAALRLADGIGCAWVATARGPLCHRVTVQDGRVADYLIIAPTEWNFHPQSAWLAHLRGARAETPEIAENLLRLWALALDPCVPIQFMLSNLSKEV